MTHDLEVGFLREGPGGWEPTAPVPARPVAVRLANRGAEPTSVAVVVTTPHGTAHVVGDPVVVPPGEALVFGRSLLLDAGDRVVVVYGDPDGVARVVEEARAERHLPPLRDGVLAEVHEVDDLARGSVGDRLTTFGRRGHELAYADAGDESLTVWGRSGPGEPAGDEPPEPPAPTAERPATRSAYGRLDAPGSVVAGAEFEVVAGIAAELSPGMTGDAMTVPVPEVRGAYPLTVLVIAEGCRLRAGESWRNDLMVTADAPFPAVTLHLTSDPVPGGAGARTVQALYSVDGVTVGRAVRAIAVVAEAAAETPPPTAAGGLFAYAVPPGYPVPDLTVRITTDPELDDGVLLWHVDSPHPSVPTWDARVATNIGDEPREFAKALMRDVNAREGKPDLVHTLRGHAVTIAEQVPPAVFDALRAAAAAAGGRPPTVLLLSAEPYVPWELALVDPPLDPAAPPFLGAQAAVGRWVLGTHRPAQPPPHRVTVGSMAVVTGVYDLPGFPRLAEAEAEVAALAETFGATPVPADLTSVVGLLGGTPPAQALHFALHGTYDPDGVNDGLKLVDGETLAPTSVRGSRLAQAPFVYLNACQVGAGNAVLGDYAGLAAAFVQAGAAAVVAPLWSVDDGIARELALRLYPAWFGNAAVGETLRRERASFGADPAPTSATVLAYQLFGHPAMTLTRQEDQ